MENQLLNIKINQDDINAAIANAAKARTELDGLKAANKELEKQKKQAIKDNQEGKKSTEQVNKVIRENNKIISQNNVEIKANSTIIRQNEKILVDNTAAQNANSGSITQLREQLKLVSKQWADLSEEERENEEIGGKLAKQKTDLTEKLKAEEKATGDTRRNVGNYSEGVQEAIQSSGLFGRQLGQLKQAQAAYSSASKLATKGTKSFGFALAATGIGAIVIAIGALVAAFSSTQKGADAISKALEPVKAVFQGLIGIAQDLSTQLFDAFKNPKQAVLDLWEAIKTNIVNRITAIPQLFKSVFDTVVASFSFLGNSIKAIVADIPIIGRGIDKASAKRNADEAADVLKQSLKDTGQALIQLNTGLDKAQQKSLVNFVKAQGDRLSIAKQTGAKIAALQIQIEQTEIDLTKRRAELNAEFERSKEIAQDDSKTEEERRVAAQKAIEAQNELLKQEQEFLDLRIQKKELENSLNDTTREDEKELAELIAQRTQAEANASKKRTSARSLLETIDREIEANRLAAIKERESAEQASNMASLNSLRQRFEEEESLQIEFEEKMADRAVANEQANRLRVKESFAQGLIDRQEYEAQLLELEENNLNTQLLLAEIAKDEALNSLELTEQERQRIIQESSDIILAIRENQADKEIDINKKKAKTEEQIEKEKERAKTQLRQLAFSVFIEIAGRESILGKAAAIAQTSINTYQGASNALANIPPPFNIPFAALTVAQGLLNVRKIVSTPTPSFASGGFTGDGYGSPDSSGYKPAGIVHEGEYVIKKSMVDNPAFSGVINAIETSRLKGYADGGFVSRSASLPATQGLESAQLQSTLSDLRNMQPIVKVTDINRVSGQAQMVRVSGELS